MHQAALTGLALATWGVNLAVPSHAALGDASESTWELQP